jgi:hypothetical protein
MVGVMLPSTTLTYVAARWDYRNGEPARVLSMAPIVVALLISTRCWAARIPATSVPIGPCGACPSWPYDLALKIHLQ